MSVPFWCFNILLSWLSWRSPAPASFVKSLGKGLVLDGWVSVIHLGICGVENRECLMQSRYLWKWAEDRKIVTPKAEDNCEEWLARKTGMGQRPTWRTTGSLHSPTTPQPRTRNHRQVDDRRGGCSKQGEDAGPLANDWICNCACLEERMEKKKGKKKGGRRRERKEALRKMKENKRRKRRNRVRQRRKWSVYRREEKKRWDKYDSKDKEEDWDKEKERTRRNERTRKDRGGGREH